jgi:hypothetical protein
MVSQFGFPVRWVELCFEPTVFPGPTVFFTHGCYLPSDKLEERKLDGSVGFAVRARKDSGPVKMNSAE